MENIFQLRCVTTRISGKVHIRSASEHPAEISASLRTAYWHIFASMKKSGALTSVKLFLLLCAFSSTVTPVVPMINLQQLQQRTQQPANDTLLVVNFWATWCSPCVEELPYFLQATKTFAGDKVKIIFVSLDFIKDHNKLSTFVANHKMENEVYHLNAATPNAWIDQIDSSWGGSIPATVMYRNGTKILFHEGELNQQQLDSLINKTKP